PGWRSGPKPSATPTPAAAAEGTTPPAEAPKKPAAKPKTPLKLNDQQKSGKQPVNSFAQLAALFKAKDAPAPEPTPEGTPTEAPPAGE
ncbi:MAG: hypothetical protein ACRC7O_11510, partial [Fimbriiglobus sp.]